DARAAEARHGRLARDARADRRVEEHEGGDLAREVGPRAAELDLARMCEQRAQLLGLEVERREQVPARELLHATLSHVAGTASVRAPARSTSSRYQRVVRARRSSRPSAPHTSESVRVVSGPVFVRCASLTALAHGPSASNRHRRPSMSIVWPLALKT